MERKADIEKSLSEVTFKSQSNEHTYVEPESTSPKKSEKTRSVSRVSDEKIYSKVFDSKADFLSFEEIDTKKVSKNDAFEQI